MSLMTCQVFSPFSAVFDIIGHNALEAQLLFIFETRLSSTTSLVSLSASVLGSFLPKLRVFSFLLPSFHFSNPLVVVTTT